jgi:TMEM175 potassium channel family protein
LNAPKTDARPSLEFERFAFFSDAVFAIALTLLVVGIAVPTVSDGDSSAAMWHALVGLRHEFISFFIGFAVIGRNWLAHHRFVAVLGAIDGQLLIVNVASPGVHRVPAVSHRARRPLRAQPRSRSASTR